MMMGLDIGLNRRKCIAKILSYFWNFEPLVAMGTVMGYERPFLVQNDNLIYKGL